MGGKNAVPLVDREVSWLAFNARVLQEAADERVPPGARLDFLAIFSSNLDEFFRVRVASLRSLLRLGRKSVDRLDVHPKRQLARIHRIVDEQQARFGEVLRTGVLPALHAYGIQLVDEHGVTEAQAAWLMQEFDARIRPHLTPVTLDDDAAPFLENRRLYLVVELLPGEGPSVTPERPRYALVEIPDTLPRFITLHSDGGRRCVAFLDDVIRLNLGRLFDTRVGAAFAVKLTRDAELYLDDEYSVDLVEAIRKSLARRNTGAPSRFLYDQQAPHGMVLFLKDRFGLADEDMVPGGRYHNLHDLHAFPRFGLAPLLPPRPAALPHPLLTDAPSVLDAIAERDHLVHLPYQSFQPVQRFLGEAAEDPEVEEIWITLYRVARDSAVVDALLEAARRGKRVTAFLEVKARFDEESNLTYGERLEAAGVRTFYSLPGLKVHCKLALVVRRGGEPRRLAYLGTGNFNEKTARVYADHGLFTADPRLTTEVRDVFAFLTGEVERPEFKHLLVAPFDLRRELYRRIDAEARAAREGRPCGMVLKMNSLEDRKIIRRLYMASRAGVPIRLIIRGISCLAPGVEGASETIEARSIVDRFLEHARMFLFQNGGREVLYLASADWMNRNLSRRVEVAFPVYDAELRRDLRALLDLQLADNVKARILDVEQKNVYASDGGSPVRAQVEFHGYLERRVRPDARIDGTQLVTSPMENEA